MCGGGCQQQHAQHGHHVARLEGVKPPFPRITYTEAVEVLQKAGHPMKWGDDIGGDEETVLASAYDRPVMVHRYPAEMKAFYFKKDPTDDKVALGNSVLRVLHYPPLEGPVEGVRSGAHEDINFLTILVAARGAGLTASIDTPDAAAIRGALKVTRGVSEVISTIMLNFIGGAGIVLAFIGGYFLGRLWIEALRSDEASQILGLRVNIWLSIIGIGGGVHVAGTGSRSRPPTRTPRSSPSSCPRAARRARGRSRWRRRTRR